MQPNYIRKFKEKNPNTPIISEEDSAHPDTIKESSYFLIDPLDGTTSYCNGYRGYVSQLAYKERNITVYALIAMPEEGVIIETLKGKGAFKNGKKIEKIFTLKIC